MTDPLRYFVEFERSPPVKTHTFDEARSLAVAKREEEPRIYRLDARERPIAPAVLFLRKPSHE